MSTFSTVLVANRGEIACRVIRGARRLGYRTVAIHSDADADALHTRLADLSVRVGPPPVRESYLDIDAVLAAARASGADAVHPGYGFLSENDAFAARCEAEGLVFIGPPSSAIRAMGNKAAAKRLMVAAGVPTIPGWEGGPTDAGDHGAAVGQDEATLVAAAGRVGFPLLVKAAAGGGGRGMRLVRDPAGLPSLLRTARAEAESAFGNGELLLERALLSARHVEIQVFADQHGNVVHLGERDCSIQRRHQKIIEESPSPAVSPALRARMGAAAVAAARTIGYVGAGTVEFLLDADGSFYFLEMNTRLQVEHPVTECVTGLDLVALQLDVAAGKPLPLSQDQVRLDGHAIEVRLYAEDAGAGFLPQTGRVARFHPGVGEGGLSARLDEGRRIDHGLRQGQEVSPWYDPMLAKLIAHGHDRQEARRRALRLLEDTVLLGVTTNKGYLGRALRHPVFVRGEATTRFIDEHLPPTPPPAADPWVVAAGALLLSHQATVRHGGSFHTATTGRAGFALRLSVDGAPVEVAVRVEGGDEADRHGHGEGGRITVSAGASRTTIALEEVDEEEGRARVNLFTEGAAISRTVRYARSGARLHLDIGERVVELEELPGFTLRSGEAEGDGRLLAAMSGRIVAVLVAAGETVVRGQTLLVLEAMKMQHPVVADRDGTVVELAVAVGDQVATRRLLARVDGA